MLMQIVKCIEILGSMQLIFQKEYHYMNAYITIGKNNTNSIIYLKNSKEIKHRDYKPKILRV